MGLPRTPPRSQREPSPIVGVRAHTWCSHGTCECACVAPPPGSGLPQKAGFPQGLINEVHGSWYDPSNPGVRWRPIAGPIGIRLLLALQA